MLSTDSTYVEQRRLADSLLPHDHQLDGLVGHGVLLQWAEVLPHVGRSLGEVNGDVQQRVRMERDLVESRENCDRQRELWEFVVVDFEFLERRQQADVDRKLEEPVIFYLQRPQRGTLDDGRRQPLEVVEARVNGHQVAQKAHFQRKFAQGVVRAAKGAQFRALFDRGRQSLQLVVADVDELETRQVGQGQFNETTRDEDETAHALVAGRLHHSQRRVQYRDGQRLRLQTRCGTWQQQQQQQQQRSSTNTNCDLYIGTGTWRKAESPDHIGTRFLS